MTISGLCCAISPRSTKMCMIPRDIESAEKRSANLLSQPWAVIIWRPFPWVLKYSPRASSSAKSTSNCIGSRYSSRLIDVRSAPPPARSGNISKTRLPLKTFNYFASLSISCDFSILRPLLSSYNS